MPGAALSTQFPRGLRMAGGLLLLLVVACSDPPGERSSVLLVTLDTTRADHLGCYGGPTEVSPNLDRLAREGVLFESAFAPATLTLPSHATLLTGNYPYQHGVRSNGLYRLPDTARTLAEVLRDEGFQTGAFVASVVLDHQFGLDQGFEVYDDFLGESGKGEFVEDRPADEVAGSFLAWLEQARRPFFAWVHFYDPHYPHDPPPEFAGRFDTDYQAEIAAADAQLGRILDAIQAGPHRDTLVIVTSDHGEAFGEHGEISHGLLLYQTTVEVPLVIQHPDLPAGRRLAFPASLADVPATVLDFLGIEPHETAGHSLLSSLEAVDEGRATPVYMESWTPKIAYGFRPFAAISDGRYKLIDTPVPELYDLETDPREDRDLAPERSEQVNAMRLQLHEMVAAEAPDAGHDVDAEAMARIASLGYAVGQADRPVRRESWTREELLAVQRLREQTRQALLANQFEECIERAAKLAEVVPDAAEAHELMGLALQRSRRHEEAARAFEKAIELQPGHDRLHWSLAHALHALGQAERGLRQLEIVLELNPSHRQARQLLADQALSRGDPSAARVHLETLVETAPRTAEGQWAARRLQALDPSR